MYIIQFLKNYLLSDIKLVNSFSRYWFGCVRLSNEDFKIMNNSTIDYVVLIMTNPNKTNPMPKPAN